MSQMPRHASLGLVSLLLMAACTTNNTKNTPAEPVELSDNIAWQDQNVRFTVVTDGLFRMEYAPDGKFVDDPSFVATLRRYPKVEAEVQETDQQVTIRTPRACLTYKKGSGPFTRDNLTIESAPELTTKFVWHPGDVQQHNLGGTYRTLDGYDGNRYYAWAHEHLGQGQPLPLEDGLLARDGWTLIDDSNGLLFDADVNDLTSPELPWVKQRQPSAEGQAKATDWYFMAYGHNYKQALGDFTQLAGRIALPPRFSFGYWWSRYWSYSDGEMRQVVSDFERYAIPLDVLVVDMDWHWTEQGLGGWTGYTWNERLFPNPEKFLNFLKQHDLKITLNLHPADGVPAYEDKYAQLATFLGRDPKSTETIRWQSSDKRFMRGWLDMMLLPLQKQGVDFWWLDWQQTLQDDSIPALSNTWWLNYCIFDNQLRTQPDHRPMLYHRWGGLGNHRYQIGFSGDTYSTWASLDYQPYFNSTASNVGYGYWSHDLGGHMFVHADDVLDRELYARWMQLGTFLPVMRSHSTKSANMQKEPWRLGPEYQDVVTAAILQRYELAPYIYTAARQAWETGVSICRPLYYDYPEADEAYDTAFRNEFMLGDQMLIAPITAPMQQGISTLNVWLPAGNDWYEVSTGTLLKGGQTVERSFLLDEYPLYIKAGSIIPTYGRVKNLARCDEEVIVTVYPGATEGEGGFYEDQGNDRDYATSFAITCFKLTTQDSNLSNPSNPTTQVITLSARRGSYDQMPAQRKMSVKVVGAAIPAKVSLDGKEVPFTYEPEKLAVCIDLGTINPSVEHKVEIAYPADMPELNDGLVGQMRRMASTMTAMKFRDAGINYIDGLGQMGSLSEALGYFPDEFAQRITQFRTDYRRLPELLDQQGLSPANKQWFLRSIGQ